jgi:hypothetical protein
MRLLSRGLRFKPVTLVMFFFKKIQEPKKTQHKIEMAFIFFFKKIRAFVCVSIYFTFFRRSIYFASKAKLNAY